MKANKKQVAQEVTMRIETIREAIQAQPFKPFTLHLPGGRNAHVPTGDFVSIHPTTGRTVVVHTEAGGSRILDVGLVTEIEFEAEATK